jgi:hypothetical protein
MWHQVWNQVSEQVRLQMWHQVWNQVLDHVWTQVVDQVREDYED